jgi:hypothetical protein
VENGRLVLSYQVRANDPTVGVTPETSTDLVNASSWSSAGLSVINLGNVMVGGEVLEKRSASVPMDETKRFLRLRVNQSQ